MMQTVSFGHVAPQQAVRFSGNDSKVVKVDASNFEDEVINSPIPVLVDFYADWCGPCRRMAPVLEQISALDELQGKVKVVKIDTQANPELAQRFNIRGIPNFKLFQNGEVTAEVVGANPQGVLKMARQAAQA